MFFIEAPQDEYGNRLYTHAPCVIEADVIEPGPSMFKLQIIAPAAIKDKWPTIRLFPGTWLECEGPARMITQEERDRLVAEAQEKIRASLVGAR